MGCWNHTFETPCVVFCVDLLCESIILEKKVWRVLESGQWLGRATVAGGKIALTGAGTGTTAITTQYQI